MHTWGDLEGGGSLVVFCSGGSSLNWVGEVNVTIKCGCAPPPPPDHHCTSGHRSHSWFMFTSTSSRSSSCHCPGPIFKASSLSKSYRELHNSCPLGSRPLGGSTSFGHHWCYVQLHLNFHRARQHTESKSVKSNPTLFRKETI